MTSKRLKALQDQVAQCIKMNGPYGIYVRDVPECIAEIKRLQKERKAMQDMIFALKRH